MNTKDAYHSNRKPARLEVASRDIVQLPQIWYLFVSDIDECGLIDVIYCDDPLELCINTLGSFHCECQEGFYWGSNGCEGLCGYESKVEYQHQLHQEINSRQWE